MILFPQTTAGSQSHTMVEGGPIPRSGQMLPSPANCPNNQILCMERVGNCQKTKNPRVAQICAGLPDLRNHTSQFHSPRISSLIPTLNMVSNVSICRLGIIRWCLPWTPKECTLLDSTLENTLELAQTVSQKCNCPGTRVSHET